MERTTRSLVLALVTTLVVGLAPAASARADVPDWVKPALHYLADQGYIERKDFDPNAPMPRADFKSLITNAFGGGFKRDRGNVTAGEVSNTLVKALGLRSTAAALTDARSPDGWDPQVGRLFGSEVVARELGLRHDRPTSEDSYEVSASDEMHQADILWAVWQAKTSPDTYAAMALQDFGLSDYDETHREVVRFALSLVGTPYVWGGEWVSKTPAGYPYGAQGAGGLDCSGFAWYVLRSKGSTWSPNRSYKGWDLPERSSSDMAHATKDKLSYRKLEPGDLAFFAPQGRDAKANDVYHVGIYLGNGWMVHSSGSRDGISLGAIGRGAWWHDQFAWGRRVITDKG
jgi:hypothetical protein